MNILKKLFHKENKQKEFTKGFISYYENIYNSIVESCGKGTMAYSSVRGMFRHLPLRYDSNKLPEDIYKITDKCIKELYEYCIKKEFIDSNITYEEFYTGKGIYDTLFKK